MDCDGVSSGCMPSVERWQNRCGPPEISVAGGKNVWDVWTILKYVPDTFIQKLCLLVTVGHCRVLVRHENLFDFAKHYITIAVFECRHLCKREASSKMRHLPRYSVQDQPTSTLKHVIPFQKYTYGLPAQSHTAYCSLPITLVWTIFWP